MKFNINREQLLAPLQQIVSVIEKRQTMPILSNVLMKADEQKLSLTGSDLEIQMVSNTLINSTGYSNITVPARKFLDICRLLPAQSEISIEQQNDRLKVVSGRSRFSLATLDADNYPEFNESKLEFKFSINTGQLKKALNKTIFCMGNQDVRYYLNGLMINISNQTLKLVASDGHRLAIFQDELAQATGIDAMIVVPRKGITELNRLLEDLDEELQIQFSSSNIKVLFDNLIFSAKLIDAKYPDFSKVYHQEFMDVIKVNRNSFKDALTRVAILSNEKVKGITLDINSDQLKISTQNLEHEEAEEELTIEYAGDKISIAFNAQYFLDAISNIDSDTVHITIASNASCCFIEDPEDQIYKYIVMPMRL